MAKAIQMTSRVNMGGMWYGKHDVKRGDTIEVPTQLDAKRLVAQGLADFGKVSPEKLGRAYEENPELGKEVIRETPNPVPEEARPRPNEPLPIGRHYEANRAQSDHTLSVRSCACGGVMDRSDPVGAGSFGVGACRKRIEALSDHL